MAWKVLRLLGALRDQEERWENRSGAGVTLVEKVSVAEDERV